MRASPELLEYVLTITRSQREWHDGEFDHARELLANAGAAHHRGWEYDYLDTLFNSQRMLSGPEGRVHAVAWSADGAWIAEAAGEPVHRDFPDHERVKIRDAATGRDLLTLEHATRLHAVAISPDGSLLATCDGTVRLWDARTGALLRTLEGENHRCMIFSPDGKRLWVGGAEETPQFIGTLTERDVETGRVLRTLKGHEDFIDYIAQSDDGQRVITACRRGLQRHEATAKVWDITAGQELFTIGDPARGRSQDGGRFRIHPRSVAPGPDKSGNTSGRPPGVPSRRPAGAGSRYGTPCGTTELVSGEHFRPAMPLESHFS